MRVSIVFRSKFVLQEITHQADRSTSASYLSLDNSSSSIRCDKNNSKRILSDQGCSTSHGSGLTNTILPHAEESIKVSSHPHTWKSSKRCVSHFEPVGDFTHMQPSILSSLLSHWQYCGKVEHSLVTFCVQSHSFCSCSYSSISMRNHCESS
jgi:hypothetical protein